MRSFLRACAGEDRAAALDVLTDLAGARLLSADPTATAFARYLQPRFNGLRRALDTYLSYYNFERVHTGRLTHGQVPADIVYGARKMEAR